MRRDVNRDERVACPPRCARPTLTPQTDLLTACYSRRDLDLNVFAGRQMNPCLGSLRGVGERNGQRCVQVLSGARRRAYIVHIELLSETTRRPAAATEHPAQEILETGAATATA